VRTAAPHLQRGAERVAANAEHWQPRASPANAEPELGICPRVQRRPRAAGEQEPGDAGVVGAERVQAAKRVPCAQQRRDLGFRRLEDRVTAERACR